MMSVPVSFNNQRRVISTQLPPWYIKILYSDFVLIYCFLSIHKAETAIPIFQPIFSIF